MIVIRGVAFIFFLALAAGMIAWQVHHLRAGVQSAANPVVSLIAMAAGLGVIGAVFAGARALRGRDNRALLAVAGVLVLPLTALVGGALSLIQARGGQHRRIWEGVLTVGALVGLFAALPIVLGLALVGGSPGLMASWTAVKFEFFVIVDYYLGRAILHYFGSGASAFVSLRYLRRRVLSLLSVLGVALGVAVLIAVNSVMQGFQRDFREQMRGSLSHLLVNFDSASIQNLVDRDIEEQVAWAAWVARIESDARVRDDWDAALDQAVLNWRAGDGDGLPDARDLAGAQPATPGNGDAPEVQLSDAELVLIERLRTGKGLTMRDRDCLRDGGVPTKPETFYLSRIADASTEEGKRHQQTVRDTVNREYYAPLFRKALQEQFDKASAVLEQHADPQGNPDVEGISWRVATKTMLTPRSGTRELNTAELVGVDVTHEPQISNLGRYVASAEINMFRDQYVLGPMNNVLGALLGWETAESVDSAPRRLVFTEDGKSVSFESLPLSMDNYLSVRGFMRQSGKIQWAPFDKVEFLEFSPGKRVYERVKLAHKMASRTEDIERLGRILIECDRDIRAILEPLATGPEPSERFERVNRTGARIILYEYLTGAGAAVGAIRYHYRDVVGVLSNLHGEEVLPPAQRAAVKALWDGLNARTDAALDLCKEPATEESARESEILAMARDYEAQLDAAIARAETQAHRGILDRLRQLRASLPDANTLQPIRNKLRNRQPLPLSVAAQRYEKGSQATARRMEAYSRALPLRTTMDDDESVEDYIARSTKAGLRPARDKPGIILGDALAEVALGTGIVVGDSISVMVPHIYYERGRLMARTSEVWFQVTGFFRSGLYEENRSRMYCDFEELTSLLADTEIRYVLGVRLADYSQYEGQRRSDELKAGVREALRDAGINQFRVSVWEDESRTLLEAVNTERTLIGLIVSFIIALTGGVIFILVYQLVNEKVKDIGILKALGYSPWGIRSVFMFNALFIGLFGAIAGGAAGMLTSEYLNSVEDFIDSATGVRLFPPEIYYLTYIPSIKGWALIELALSIVVPVVLFSFLCGIYPALLAAKKDPVEALHYE